MTEGQTAVATDLRGRLALALDVDDLVAAVRLGRELQPWFGVAKIGLELYMAAGPDSISALSNMGYEVFVDAKLHDIPTTVGKAARVLSSLGARYVTIHAHGGVVMLRAGVEGLKEGASAAGLPEPTALAVTVLTSDRDAPAHIVPNRIRTAVEGGCGGIVCAAGDVKDAKQLAPRLRAIVTGIRFAGGTKHDQARAATPREAFDAGADLLVVGRAVTQADNPVAAATRLVEELS